MSLTLKVEFSGGLELLFANQKKHCVSLPAKIIEDSEDGTPATKRPSDMRFLIHYLKEHLLKERPELFVENDTVRPGILVLINDTDWELEGEEDYILQENDDIVFISTLHGG